MHYYTLSFDVLQTSVKNEINLDMQMLLCFIGF